MISDRRQYLMPGILMLALTAQAYANKVWDSIPAAELDGQCHSNGRPLSDLKTIAIFYQVSSADKTQLMACPLGNADGCEPVLPIPCDAFQSPVLQLTT